MAKEKDEFLTNLRDKRKKDLEKLGYHIPIEKPRVLSDLDSRHLELALRVIELQSIKIKDLEWECSDLIRQRSELFARPLREWIVYHLRSRWYALKEFFHEAGNKVSQEQS